MPKLMAMIEAYGQAMAQAQPKVAAKRLAEIEQALDNDGAELFETFWKQVPGAAYALGAGDSPDFMKLVMELLWSKARRTLVQGGEPSVEFTPEYFEKMRAAHAGRKKTAKKAASASKAAVVRKVAEATAAKKTPAKTQRTGTARVAPVKAALKRTVTAR